MEPALDGANTDIEIVAGDRGAGTSGGFQVRKGGQVHHFASTVDLQQWLTRRGLDLGQLVAPGPDEDGCE